MWPSFVNSDPAVVFMGTPWTTSSNPTPIAIVVMESQLHRAVGYSKREGFQRVRAGTPELGYHLDQYSSLKGYKLSLSPARLVVNVFRWWRNLGGPGQCGCASSGSLQLSDLCQPSLFPTQIWDLPHPQTQLCPSPVRRNLGTEAGFESPRQLLPSAKV